MADYGQNQSRIQANKGYLSDFFEDPTNSADLNEGKFDEPYLHIDYGYKPVLSALLIESGIKISDILKDVGVVLNEMFQGVKGIGSIHLPDNIKSVGTFAFMDSDIEEFIAGEGLDYISTSAFNKCDNLKKVVLSNTTFIQDGAFWYCTNLTELDIPSNCVISLRGLPPNLKELVLPPIMTKGYLVSTYSKSELKRILPTVTYSITVEGVKYQNGKELFDSLDFEKPIKDTLYRISDRNSQLTLTPSTSKSRTKVASVRLSFAPVRGRYTQVFFKTYDDAVKFIDNYNNLGKPYKASLDMIHEARLGNYDQNFHLVETEAGDCLIQSWKESNINPAFIKKKNIF